MSSFCFNNVKILGMAAAVPNEPDDIMHYARFYPDGEIEKFCNSTGIYHRYVGYKKGIIASDLCVSAAEKILTEDIKERIDALIYMSQSFDYIAPATAGTLQLRLGLKNCGATYDVTFGCAAFPFGMQMSASFINSGCRNVLLLIGDAVTSESIEDKDAFLFGDAGCAILIGPQESKTDSTIIELKTQGEKWQSIMNPFGGYRHKYSNIAKQIGPQNASRIMRRFMNGADVFSFSIKDAPAATKEFYAKNNCGPEDFDFAAIHQANALITKNVAKRIGFPMEKVPLSLGKYGNTNGSSVVMTICNYFENNPWEGKKRILSLAFGIGMNIGICAFSLEGNAVNAIMQCNQPYDDGLRYEKYLREIE